MTNFIQTALMDNIEGRSFLEGQGPIVPPPPPDLGTPAYAISLAPSSVREGNELVATITTSNLSNSTRLFVTIGSGGSAVGADFTSSPWPVVIENNKAILRIKPKIDNLIESGETVQLQLRTVSKTGTVVALSNIIGITDIPLPPVPPPLPSRPRILTPVPPPPPPPASPPPQYTIAISPITLMENKVNTIQIYTTNVPDSTDLYVTLNSAGTATYDDFILLPLRTTVSNNNASRSVFSVNDALAETETVQFDLRTGSTGGPVVATTGLLNLIDFVSTLLPKTYSLSLSKFNIAEGETFTGTVTTSNVVAGTVLYLAVLDGGTANAADFTGLPTTVTIANKIGTFSATVALDGISELAESAQIGLYTDAAYTDLVASSGLLLISKSGGEVGVSGYAVSIIPATVAEGASFTATVTTTNVPNGTVLQLTANPFDSASAVDLVGSPWNVTINSNTGTVTIPTAVDGTSENTETLRLLLKSTATGETILATSNSVNIVDITAPPTYELGMSHLIITEGTSFTITVHTTNVANGTVLYVTQDMSQSGNAADITGIPRTVTINNNTGTATGTVVADNLTEGAETTRFLLRTGNFTGPVVATSTPLLINDTSVTPALSYTLVATPATVSESGIITVNITTTAVPNGTVVYASMGTTGTATTSDFSNTLWTVTINNNSGVFAANLIADLTTEGTETVDFVIKTGSQAGPIVAVSNLVTISDTSNTGGNTASYSLLLSPTSANEGSTVTGTITTSNVANATTLYITPTGTGVANDADFVGEPWTATINNNTASFSFTVTADSTTEGVETKVLHLRTGSGSGPVVAASNVLIINDTSTGGGGTAQYALIATPATVDEGGYVTLDIRTANVAANTPLYVTVNNPGDYTETQWSVIVMNNTTSLVNQAYRSPLLKNDLTTEGAETSTFSLRTGSYNGSVVATASISINDTSTGSGGGASTLTFESGTGTVNPGPGQSAVAVFAVSPAMSASGASISATISALNSSGNPNFGSNGYRPMDDLSYRLRTSSGFGGWTILPIDDGPSNYPSHNINIPVGTTGIEFSLVANSVLATTSAFKFDVISNGSTGWSGSQSASHTTQVAFISNYTLSSSLPYASPVNGAAYLKFGISPNTTGVVAMDVGLVGVGTTLTDLGVGSDIEYSYEMVTPVFYNTPYNKVTRTGHLGGTFTGYIVIPLGARSVTFMVPVANYNPLATGSARITLTCNTVGLVTNSPYSANVNLS